MVVWAHFPYLHTHTFMHFLILFSIPAFMNNFISFHKNKSIIMSFIVTHEIHPKTNICGQNTHTVLCWSHGKHLSDKLLVMIISSFQLPCLHVSKYKTIILHCIITLFNKFPLWSNGTKFYHDSTVIWCKKNVGTLPQKWLYIACSAVSM